MRRPMRRTWTTGCVGALVAALSLTPAHAIAQDNDPFYRTTRGALVGLLWESAGFREGEMDALRGLIQAQTTTFPIGSSAGGFSWSFNPELAVPTRRSQSFGPMFAERPLTTGRYRLNVSLAFQRTQWKSLAGSQLSDGLVFTTTNFYDDENFEQRSVIDLATEQTIVNATFGVTDRIDIGVIVPYVRQRASGQRHTAWNFAPDVITETYSGKSAGIGDVTIRGKVGLPSARVMDFAMAVDVRLPTGDKRELLGAGGLQTTAMLAGAARSGAVAPHFNVGYVFGGKGLPEVADLGLEQGDFKPSDEFKYTIGSEFVLSGAVTVAGDVIGRTMFAAPVPVQTTQSSLGSGYTSSGLTIRRGTLNLLLGAVSVKVMVADSWLLTAAIAFPLNSNGLTPGITPVIGFERAF
jgi:hypothetical protein